MADSAKFLLLDTNVLSDFLQTDESILTLVARKIGQIYIPSTIVEECSDLSLDDCERLGLIVIEPTLDQIAEASIAGGRLSFEDKTCLLICREEGFVCVTNDKLLRKTCLQEKLSVKWGLQLLIELVEMGEISEEIALTVAADIHKINPHSITDSVFKEFKAKLTRLFDETIPIDDPKASAVHCPPQKKRSAPQKVASQSPKSALYRYGFLFSRFARARPDAGA